MTGLDWIGALAALGERLATASLVAGIAGVLALGWLRLLPATAARARAALWWLVAARTLAELAGLPALDLALLPAPASRAERAADFVVVTPAPPIPVETLGQVPAWASSAAALRGGAGRGPVELAAAAAAGAWLVAMLLAGAHEWRRLSHLSRTLRRAGPIADPAVRAAFGRAAAWIGMRGRVALLASPEVETPQTAGVLSPAVLLPAGAAVRLDARELELVLAHELVHVRRRDGLVALVPALAERLFFFHPMLRFVAREYRLAVETACDAEVVRRSAAAPAIYGRLLVRLASPRSCSRNLATAWSLARSPLARRLAMLDVPIAPSPRVRILAASALVLACVAAVPVRLIASPPDLPPIPASAPVAPTVAGLRAVTAPLPPPMPAPPATTGRLAPAAPAATTPPLPELGIAPVPPAAPLPPVAPSLSTLSALGIDAWVLVAGDRRWEVDAGREDLARVEAERRGGEPLFWFRKGASEYIVRERELVAEISRSLDEELEGVHLQATLAGRQAAAAGAVARIAGEAGRLAAEQGRLAAREIAVAADQLGRELEGRVEAEVGRALAELERGLAAEGRRLEALESEYHANLAAFAREAERIGREIEWHSAGIGRRVAEQLERAIVSGQAQPLD